MNKRFLLSLVGMMFCLVTMAITEPEEGKYYRIINQNPEKAVTTGGQRYGYAITENIINHEMTAEAQGGNTKYNQIWKYTKGKFQNAHTSQYFPSLGVSQKGLTNTNGTTVKLTNKGSYYLLKAGNGVHADNGNNIVGWNDDNNSSNWWCFEEVTIDAADLAEVQQKYSEMQAQKSSLEAVAAKEAVYAPIVEGYFTDGACTELKAEFAAMSDDDFKARMTADELPELIQDMVLTIKNKWANELNPELSERFRVQNYGIYTRCQGPKDKWVSTQLADMNNPTGIWTNSLQLMYVFVEGDIPQGASLRIAGAEGSQITLIYHTAGVELHKGLNIVYCGTDCTNQWIMYTCEANYNKPLSEYPDLKIHIEGGDVIGYVDVVGKDEATTNAEYETIFKHAKNLLASKNVNQKKTNFTIKGERGIMVFPVECYDQIWSDREWWGTVYGYKIYKSMKFYDNVLKWEWDAMGWQDRVETGEADDDLENLAKGYGDAIYPTYVNNLAPTMMLFEGKNPYSGSSYTCMPSIAAVESSYNGERANFDVWCVGHESGHNNQHTINLPSSMESSNNYFSNLITYMYGHRMSRGWNFMSNVGYAQDKIIFSQRDISITLRMYYNLWLYYHRAGHNKGFTQKLHKLLRADRMSFGGEGWHEGSYGGASKGTAANSWLKFYEKACEAAGEDLTEYFRLWGFFIPTSEAGGSIEKIGNTYYAYCGDYSSYYIRCEQKDIDAAIKRVKAKGYRENKEIMFIEDRLKLQQRHDPWAKPGDMKPDNGGTLRSQEWLNNEYGDLGFVDEYKEGNASKAENYTYSIGGLNVKMQGQGGVGILVYDEEGNIAYMSNKLNFTLPASVANGKYTIKVIQGDGEEVEAISALESNDPAILRTVLSDAVEASKDITNMVDDKTVGFYQSSDAARLRELVAQGNAALSANDEAAYKELAQAIGAEIVNVSLNAKKNEIRTDMLYTLKNYERNRYLTTASSTSANLTTDSKWAFVPSGQDGWYYLQNADTKQLINDFWSVNATSLSSAKMVQVKQATNGSWYLKMYNSKDKLKCINNTPSQEQIIQWDETAGSAWYIAEIEAIDAVSEAELVELQQSTKTLLDMAGTLTTSVQKLPLQCTDATAPYYIKTNRADANFPIANLIDGDKTTDFATKQTGTNVSNITLDLGEGNEANYLRITCYTTTKQDGSSPKEIVVMPSNTSMTSGFVTSQTSTFSDLPDGSNKSYYNDTKESEDSYRYWRIQVTKTQNVSTGKPYFSLAEMQIRTLVANLVLNDDYSTLDPKIFKQTNAGYTNSVKTLSNLSTMLTNKANYDKLKELHDALLEAMEAIKSTPVEGIEANGNAAKAIYDLQGRRVQSANKPGIYVVNGKKVVVK